MYQYHDSGSNFVYISYIFLYITYACFGVFDHQIAKVPLRAIRLKLLLPCAV